MNILDISKRILGPPDANDDDNLNEYFISFGDFEDLMGKNRFIIVGPKGTGKSAIKKHVCMTRKENKQMVIDIDDSYGFPLSELKTQSSAEIKNKMKVYFKSIILRHLVDSEKVTQDKRNKINGIIGDMPWYQKLIKPVKLKLVVAEYAISELFPTNKRGQLLQLLDPKIDDLIIDIIGNNDLWIVIDDIDTVFTSDDDKSSLRFVEGLIYSASDLSIRNFKKKVWIILLLRSEIYEELTRMATDLDKEVFYFWEIVWDDNSLKKCLAERIRWAANAEKGLPIWEYWSMLFDSKNEKSTTSLQSYLIERLINGPRDLLFLVDLARETAYSKKATKIKLSHIKESETKYGKQKLLQITSNFQRIYQDIDKVIDRLFRGKKQVYTREELEAQINNDLLTNPGARDDFRHLLWLRTCTSYLFIDIIYKIGVIGYWDPSAHRFIYVLQKSNPDETLLHSAKFKLHSALANYLELTS